MLGLRGKTFTEAKRLSVSGKKKSFALPESNSGACEITLDMNKGKSSKILLTLSNKEGECVSMWYDTAANTFSVDRRKSGITDFSQDFASVTGRVLALRNCIVGTSAAYCQLLIQPIATRRPSGTSLQLTRA